MIIGILKEIKNHEYRVGLSPNSARELVTLGHTVIVESGAGVGVNFTDDDYRHAGARIVSDAQGVFADAEMIVKVKEPQAEECAKLRPGQTLFTYLHLAADHRQAEALVASGATCIAYETVTDDDGGLPLLSPMSEVAGRMSVQAGAYHLEKAHGGGGILLGGVPGVAPGSVTIIGGGVVGENAAQMALGLGAHVTILDRSLPRLRTLDKLYSGNLECVYSTPSSVNEYVTTSDLVIGAVLIPGATAPKLVTKDMIKRMRPGSVVVDVAIDQGGCFETSRPTTHEAPTFIVDEIVHYCVANMPGGCARTATLALNNATLPFVLALANQGVDAAIDTDPHLRNGVNIHDGRVTHPAVAESLNCPYAAIDTPRAA